MDWVHLFYSLQEVVAFNMHTPLLLAMSERAEGVCVCESMLAFLCGRNYSMRVRFRLDLYCINSHVPSMPVHQVDSTQ